MQEMSLIPQNATVPEYFLMAERVVYHCWWNTN